MSVKNTEVYSCISSNAFSAYKPFDTVLGFQYI